MARWKSVALGAGVVLLVLGVLGGVKASQIGAMIAQGEAFVPPPIAVTTATAEPSTWSRSVTAVGTLVAIQEVTIASEVPGTVVALPFESGDDVRRGAVLARLDTSTERAELASAVAAADLAGLELARTRSLRQQSAIAQAALDTSEAQQRQAAAAVDRLRALIAKKTIRAPFDGRLGIREANLGQVVSPGTAIVSLQSLDPIWVELTLPEQAAALVGVGQTVRATLDVFPGETWEGPVDVVDAAVDRETRTLRLRATLPNPDARLRPGMFADVEVAIPGERAVTLIPSTAVLYAPYGDSVYVVEGDGDGGPGTAQQVFVRLGERRGDFVEVLSGLEAGATIVTTGAFKLRNGVAVTVQNDLAPSPVLDPEPANE